MSKYEDLAICRVGVKVFEMKSRMNSEVEKFLTLNRKAEDFLIKFSLEIEPLPQTRPRFSRGRCFEPARMKEYKAKIRQAAVRAMAGLEPLTGAVKVLIKLCRKFKATSKRFGDLDNHAKAICDSLNGVCYVDDSQIVLCQIEKQTGEAKVEVKIESVSAES